MSTERLHVHPAARSAAPGARRPSASISANSRAQRRGAEPAGLADVRAHQLVAQVGGQHAPGRQHRGHARHDHPREISSCARDIGHVQPGRAAEREQREAPRIDAAAHRDEADALGHAGVDDAVDALGRGHAVDAERLARRARRAASRGGASSCARPPRKLSGSSSPSTRLASVTVAAVAAPAVAGRARARRRRSRARRAACRRRSTRAIEPPPAPSVCDVHARQRHRCRRRCGRPVSVRLAAARRARCPCWCRPCRTR